MGKLERMDESAAEVRRVLQVLKDPTLARLDNPPKGWAVPSVPSLVRQ